MSTRVLTKIFVRLVVCGFCACAFASAEAVSFDYLDSSEQLDFNPGHFVLDGTGAWAVGNATVHFRADGSSDVVVPSHLAGGDALIARTPDGGVVEAPLSIFGTPQAVPCSIFKRNSNGALQWQQAIGARCDWLASDANGVIWVMVQAQGLQLYRVSADGSGFAPVSVDRFVLLGTQPVLAGATGGIYLVGSSDGAASPSASIVKLDSNGNVAWRWADSPSTSSGSRLHEIALDAAGNIHAAGADSPIADASLIAVSLTPTGALRWTRHYDNRAADGMSGFATATDGSSYVVVRPSGSPAAVDRIGDDGTLAWTHAIPLDGPGSFLSSLDYHWGVRVAANGDALVLADSPASSVASVTKLFRFSPDGNVIATSTITGRPDSTSVGVSAMTTLPDSSVLLTTYSNTDLIDAAGVSTSAASTGQWLHLDRSGQVLPRPFAVAKVVYNASLLDSVIEPDGTTYLLTQTLLNEFSRPQDNIAGAIASRYALTKISPQGTRMWKSAWDGYWLIPSLSVGPDRICIGGDRADYYIGGWDPNHLPVGGIPDMRVQCHAKDTGATMWSTVLQAHSASSAPSPLAFRVLSDSTSVASYLSSDPSEQVMVASIDAAGHAIQTHTSSTAQTTGVGADGNLLLQGTLTPTLEVARPDGTVLYEQTLTSVQTIAAAEYLHDGTVQFLGISADAHVVLGLLGTNGSVRWTTSIADASTTTNPLRFSASSDGGDIFVALSVGQTSTQLLRIDRATGSIGWRKTIEVANGASSIVLNPGGTKFGFFSFYPHKIGYQVVDRASGSSNATTFIACGAADCEGVFPGRVGVSADGTLRFVLGFGNGYDSASSAAQVIGIDSVFAHSVTIPAAQTGVSGAWYAPYESGQGFLIDYIASAHLIFIPWFTYTQAGGNDPAALAWFTLEGSPASGGTDANFTIYSTEGGIFQSGTVAAHSVGSAQIQFFDCNHGKLSYQFHQGVNGGAQGSIDIMRLTPSTVPCQLASGATQPAGNANPPGAGFDAKQGGSWHDPATSGQGVEFAVIPAGNGFPGTLFGAWFTYDPAGAADDPSQQHWFTLQGDLSAASGGSVTVPIYGTIGGSFDNAPTSNTTRVGEAIVTFAGCTSVTVDYRFDNTDAAHAYRGLSGSMHLAKLGGCS